MRLFDLCCLCAVSFHFSFWRAYIPFYTRMILDSVSGAMGFRTAQSKSQNEAPSASLQLSVRERYNLSLIMNNSLVKYGWLAPVVSQPCFLSMGSDCRSVHFDGAAWMQCLFSNRWRLTVTGSGAEGWCDATYSRLRHSFIVAQCRTKCSIDRV